MFSSIERKDFEEIDDHSLNFNQYLAAAHSFGLAVSSDQNASSSNNNDTLDVLNKSNFCSKESLVQVMPYLNQV